MRKLVTYVVSILLVLFIVGCNNTNERIYNKDGINISNSTLKKDLHNKSTLLSEDICVIDKKQQNTNDNIITANGALLINTTKNQCMFSKDLYTKMYPASITKLITALVTIKKCDLKETVTVSKEAVTILEEGARKCGFKEGDQISLEALLKAMLVYSGNDAALAIAMHVSGSQEKFAIEMNNVCKMVGASNTNFVNPHGLHDDNQYTTPYDLYLLMNELVNYTEIFDMYGLDSYKCTYKSGGIDTTKTFEATNKYVTGQVKEPQDIKVLGGKTGTTDKAGNCLILNCKNTITKDDYIAVVLNANSSEQLYTQMSKLLSYAQ